MCDKGFIWNPSNCECECDKSCDKLIEECTENIEGLRLVEKTTAKNENKHKCSSCTVYIVLFSIILAINIGIGIYFVYSRCYLKNYDARFMLDTCIETTIY